jgi:hypothetical protein
VEELNAVLAALENSSENGKGVERAETLARV